MKRTGPLLVFLALGGMVGMTVHEVLTRRAEVPPVSRAAPGAAGDGEGGGAGPPAGAGRGGRDTARSRSASGAAAPAPGERADRLEGLRVEVSHRRHDVSGSTAREIRSSLTREGRRIEGELAPAWTDWRVDIGYEYRRRGERCRITVPDVEVLITVHLPRWTDSALAPAALREKWRRDVRAMERHEQGHVRLARKAGRRVHGVLADLPRAPCGRLRARADSAAAAVLEEARAAQRRYDRLTDHGRRQRGAFGGARLRSGGGSDRGGPRRAGLRETDRRLGPSALRRAAG